MNCPTCGKGNPADAQFCGVCGANLISGETAVGTELPMVGFGQAISSGFSNYFTFSGRATRGEFWWWFLFQFLIGLIPFAFLVTLIPELAVTSRRLHDSGRSGWLQIIPLTIVVVSFVMALSFPVGDGGLLFGIGLIVFFTSSFVVITFSKIASG